MFQLAEGRAVLLVYTAIRRALERVAAVSLSVWPYLLLDPFLPVNSATSLLARTTVIQAVYIYCL